MISATYRMPDVHNEQENIRHLQHPPQLPPCLEKHRRVSISSDSARLQNNHYIYNTAVVNVQGLSLINPAVNYIIVF